MTVPGPGYIKEGMLDALEQSLMDYIASDSTAETWRVRVIPMLIKEIRHLKGWD